MDVTPPIFTKILENQGYFKLIELTIRSFRTLNLVNDYILDKIDDLNRREKYTLGANRQLAYAFGAQEFEDYNQVYARCKVFLSLFDEVLRLHDQDILDEYGPHLGGTLVENSQKMHELLALGKKWIIDAESNPYDVDLELNVWQELSVPAN